MRCKPKNCAMQASLKQQYREAPASAVITLSARGNLDAA